MAAGSLFLVIALGASARSSQETVPPEGAGETWTLGAIEIVTHPIYSDTTAADSALAKLVNATHWTTWQSVVRREIWIAPGDLVTERVAEELERNLRASGLFAEVEAKLRATDDPDVRDLVVRTRDRLSISGGASGSFVGDIVSGGFSLSESNLFGSGDRLRFSFFENDQDEFRGALSYRDRYFLGTWTTFNAEVGRTEAGTFGAIGFARPFRHLEDDYAWNLGLRTDETERNYFQNNETVAEVPFDAVGFSSSSVWRDGDPDQFWTRGLTLDVLDRDYGLARGPAADQVRVPGDTQSLFLGGSLGVTNISEFRKARGIDTLGFVQDLQLGTSASALIGGTYRDEEGAETELQPTFGLNADASLGLGPARYVTASVSGDARTVSGEAVGWSARAELRAFDLTFRPHTLASALSYIEAEETQNLPVQLVLGEGNGLRGYPRREFTGQRILRMNFEDRIDLDARLGAFDFGAVVFADLGWISERGTGFGHPLRSVGVGLRIGSTSLLGSGVLRLDLSFPLDDFEGESYDPLISFSLGQVFAFR